MKYFLSFTPADLTAVLYSHSFVLLAQVLLPLDNPSGNITGTLRRKQLAKLWMTLLWSMQTREEMAVKPPAPHETGPKGHRTAGNKPTFVEKTAPFIANLWIRKSSVMLHVGHSLTHTHTFHYRRRRDNVESTTVKNMMTTWTNKNIKGSEL